MLYVFKIVYFSECYTFSNSILFQNTILAIEITIGIVIIENNVETATNAVENSASPSYRTANTVNNTPIGAAAGIIDECLTIESMKGQNTNKKINTILFLFKGDNYYG